MKEFPIISDALDRVANCMPEIQNRTLARPVPLVFHDDSGFDLDITKAIPNGAQVEVDPQAERPFIRVL